MYRVCTGYTDCGGLMEAVNLHVCVECRTAFKLTADNTCNDVCFINFADTLSS